MADDRAVDGRDVEIRLRRLDSSAGPALTAWARQGADAFGCRAELRLDRRLAQLLPLRVAQLNHCTYCLELHHRIARELGIPAARIDTLSAWWETELHGPADRAALRYAEVLTRAAELGADGALQRAHDELAAHVDADEVLEVVGVVLTMHVWTRLKLAEGAMPGPADG